MKGRQIAYSVEEMAWLEANRSMVIRDYAREFCAKFGREVAAVNLHALRKRKGWKTGRTGCFQPGAAPANKGQKMPYYPNSAATRFKKGERRGVAVKLYKPIGSERIDKNGYLERKIHDGMPLQSRWRAVHLVRWEAINGPLVKGFALKSLDGDKTNTDPANWTPIPRALLPRLNGGRGKQHVAYDSAPAELKPTILAVAKLEHKARKAKAAQSHRNAA
jgi:hypothetical protein